MTKRNGRTRSVGLILIGLMLGAVTIAPAFANHTPKHSAKQIKKLNKKVKKVNNTVKTLPTTSAVQQSIDASIAAVAQPFSLTLDTNGQEKAIVTHGPLRYFAKCTINDTDVDRVEIYADSSVEWWDENNSTTARPANTPVVALFETSTPTGTPSFDNDTSEHSMAASQAGSIYSMGIEGDTVSLGLNVLGHKCFAAGTVFLQKGTA